MRHYCTYFDHKFIPRGLALLASLRRHGGPFRLYVLCLDDLCYDALVRQQLPDIVPIALPALEAYDRDLSTARARRSLIEYYFTLTPAFPLYLLAAYPDIDIITYLDSDLYFFGNPEAVFEELGGGSVAIIGHRFTEEGRFRERYGVFNVGWVSWRRDESGLACLEWYRERCLEWCFDAADGVRFADQKYLDEWPERFPRVRSIAHKGCNLAPWNVENYKYSLRNDRLYVDDDPLVFYHFHGFKKFAEPAWENTVIDSYRTTTRPMQTDMILERIYRPYSDAMLEAIALFDTFGIKATPPMELRHTGAPPGAIATTPWRWHLDWTRSGSSAPPAPPGLDPKPARFNEPTPRPQTDGQLLAGPGVSTLLPSLITPDAEEDLVEIDADDVFERADWEHVLVSMIDARSRLVLHGVHTFTATPTTCVQRRSLGSDHSSSLWIVQRRALKALLRSYGHRIEKEWIWPESIVIDEIPERADRRTIVLSPAAV